MANTFLPQNGSYRALRVYKITEIIYVPTSLYSIIKNEEIVR